MSKAVRPAHEQEDEKVQTAEPTRASRRKARTIKAILDAAEQQFLKHGFYATTMESIARDVDMAVGSLYFYFENKDALYYGVLERALAILEGSLAEAASRDLPPFQKLYAISDAYTSFAFEHMGYFRMLIFPHSNLPSEMVTAANTKYNEQLNQRVELLIALLTSILAETLSAGEHHHISAERAARFLFGAWNGVIALHLRPDTLWMDSEEIKAILNQAAWVLTEGILAVMKSPGGSPVIGISEAR